MAQASLAPTQDSNHEPNTPSVLDTLPPEKLLSDRLRMIRGGIACIKTIDELQEYVAYENQHQNRVQVLNLLQGRAEEIRTEQ